MQGVPVLKVSDPNPKRGWVGKDYFGKKSPFIEKIVCFFLCGNVQDSNNYEEYH